MKVTIEDNPEAIQRLFSFGYSARLFGPLSGSPCPRPGCRGTLVLRRCRARGNLFYGCSEYPHSCRNTVEYACSEPPPVPALPAIN